VSSDRLVSEEVCGAVAPVAAVEDPPTVPKSIRDDPLSADVKGRQNARGDGARSLIVKVAGRGLRIGKPTWINRIRLSNPRRFWAPPSRIAHARQDFPGVNLSLGGPGIFCLLRRAFCERKTGILLKFYR